MWLPGLSLQAPNIRAAQVAAAAVPGDGCGNEDTLSRPFRPASSASGHSFQGFPQAVDLLGNVSPSSSFL